MLILDENRHIEVVPDECLWCGKPLDSKSQDGCHSQCTEELVEALHGTELENW